MSDDATFSSGSAAPRPRRRGARFRKIQLPVGMILSRSFSIFFRRFTTLGPICALILSPLLLLRMALALDPGELTWDELQGANYSSGAMEIILGLFAAGAMTTAVERAASGRPADAAADFLGATRSFFSLLVLGVVGGIAISVSVLFCCLPGVALGVIWFSAPAATVLEKRGPFSAMRRSAHFMLRVFWPVLAIWLLLSVVGESLVGSAVQLLLLSEPPLAAVGCWLVTVVATGVLGVAQTLVFLSCREQAEGMGTRDLEEIFG